MSVAYATILRWGAGLPATRLGRYEELKMYSLNEMDCQHCCVGGQIVLMASAGVVQKAR